MEVDGCEYVCAYEHGDGEFLDVGDQVEEEVRSLDDVSFRVGVTESELMLQMHKNLPLGSLDGFVEDTFANQEGSHNEDEPRNCASINDFRVRFVLEMRVFRVMALKRTEVLLRHFRDLLGFTE